MEVEGMSVGRVAALLPQFISSTTSPSPTPFPPPPPLFCRRRTARGAGSLAGEVLQAAAVGRVVMMRMQLQAGVPVRLEALQQP